MLVQVLHRDQTILLELPQMPTILEQLDQLSRCQIQQFSWCQECAITSLQSTGGVTIQRYAFKMVALQKVRVVPSGDSNTGHQIKTSKKYENEFLIS